MSIYATMGLFCQAYAIYLDLLAGLSCRPASMQIRLAACAGALPQISFNFTRWYRGAQSLGILQGLPSHMVSEPVTVIQRLTEGAGFASKFLSKVICSSSGTTVVRERTAPHVPLGTLPASDYPQGSGVR